MLQIKKICKTCTVGFNFPNFPRNGEGMNM